MIIVPESLNQLFARAGETTRCRYCGKCRYCGCDVDIEITRTSGGFGLLGGVLCETLPENLYVLCTHCYQTLRRLD